MELQTPPLLGYTKDKSANKSLPIHISSRSTFISMMWSWWFPWFLATLLPVWPQVWRELPGLDNSGWSSKVSLTSSLVWVLGLVQSNYMTSISSSTWIVPLHVLSTPVRSHFQVYGLLSRKVSPGLCFSSCSRRSRSDPTKKKRVPSALFSVTSSTGWRIKAECSNLFVWKGSCKKK